MCAAYLFLFRLASRSLSPTHTHTYSSFEIFTPYSTYTDKEIEFEEKAQNILYFKFNKYIHRQMWMQTWRLDTVFISNYRTKGKYFR